jgi:hypothetical protein
VLLKVVVIVGVLSASTMYADAAAAAPVAAFIDVDVDVDDVVDDVVGTVVRIDNNTNGNGCSIIMIIICIRSIKQDFLIVIVVLLVSQQQE